MLRDRVLSALVGLPPLFLLVYVGDPWFSLAVAAVAAWASIEFYRMVRSAGYYPLGILGTAFSVLLIGAAYADANNLWSSAPGGMIVNGNHTASLFALATVLTLVILLFVRAPATVLMDWALTLAGILYTGLLLAYFVSLRQLPNGFGWVLVVLLSTFAADTVAYFVGRRFGAHRLAPVISPKKSWEGTIAGWVAAVVTAWLVATVLDLGGYVQLSGYPVHALILGGIVGLVGQFGDLGESMLKRSAGVKDSSTAIPGHGGVLDRIDSLAFAAVAAYHYIVLVAIV